MTSAVQHLAQFGVSLADANAFVLANLEQPAVIFNVARDYGVTNAMLGEIAGGFTAAEVTAFFQSKGIDSSGLDASLVAPPPTDPGDGLFNQFPQEWLSLLPALISLNDNTGVLSNESIRAQVIQFSGVSEQQYFRAFDPENLFGAGVAADGILTTAELGFSHLGNLQATPQTVESLIYGSIIRVFKSIDENEVAALEAYVTNNESGLTNLDTAVVSGLIDLVVDALATPANPPLFSDEELSFTVTFVGVVLVGVLEEGTLPGLGDFLFFG